MKINEKPFRDFRSFQKEKYVKIQINQIRLEKQNMEYSIEYTFAWICICSKFVKSVFRLIIVNVTIIIFVFYIKGINNCTE